MGTVTAKSIIDKAATQLIDIANVRWTRAELLAWLNDGLRQIVLLQPNATNTVASVRLTAGTRQQLPTDGWMLLDVIRNMGTSGSTPGRAIRVIAREVMDGFDPDWHSTTASTVVQNYIYSLEDQTAFYVYPPSPGTNYIEINYSRQPTDLVAETGVIPVFDIYQSALVDYILFRACSKDGEYTAGLAMAQMYLGTFVSAVTGKESSENKNSPDLQLFPSAPSPAASNP